MNFPRFFQRYTFVLSIALFPIASGLAQGTKESRAPRLIVLTDISSLAQNEGEPDDGQSLIRLMFYTNELDIEGLIATSNLRHGQRTRPELIKKVVESYGMVHSRLSAHDKRFPPASELLNVIKQGQPIAGPKIPVDQSVGENKDTEGSDWIIKVVDKNDARPVWITIWGGSADLAQALWKVRATRTSEQLDKFVKKLKVHFIYDQDMTSAWIRREFPQLYCIFRHHGIRGMYRGGDTTLVRSRWVESNIRGHGALGDLYVNYRGGDVWGSQLGRVTGIKEGDTPSYLYLLTNGLNNADHPEWGGWSGRFKKEDPKSNLWVEAVDSIHNYKVDMDPRMAALYRWRPAWQADFAARLDWSVNSYEDANHKPEVKVTEKPAGAVRSGKTVKLSVNASDPDKDDLRYHWYFYPEAGSYDGALPVLDITGNTAVFTAPKVRSEQTVHVIAEVTDNGMPGLTSYQRFVISIKP